MGRFNQYLIQFRAIKKYLWVKIALSIWAILGSYDVLLSQFIPEKFSKHLPKAWQVAIMTGHLLPVWGWFLILAAILVFASFEYSFRLTRQQKTSSKIPIKEPEQPKDERIKIRRIGDQVFQTIDGKRLVQKWGIEPHNFLNIVRNQFITAYTPDENTDIIANKDKEDFDLSMSFYQENNEIDEDTVTHFRFKPQDIREFEGKVKNGLLPEYILLKTKWKRKNKIKKEDTKHMTENKKEDTERSLVENLKIEQNVEGAKKVKGLEVENQDIELHTTSINMKVKNAEEVTGASFKQINKAALSSYAIMCECGERINRVFSGTPPNMIKCPKCGKETVLKKGV